MGRVYLLRTILIFPQLNNIEIIDEIRNRYDPLAKLIRPHITLVFPFESEITNDELDAELTRCVEHIAPFELELRGFSKTNDHYLFMNIDKGKDMVKSIHNNLYSNYFNKYDSGLSYIPHMTVGKLNSVQELDEAYEYVSKIDSRFKTIVSKISVEMIGEHEESIIVFEKILN